ncbi:hypothetical protein [Nocardia terpenica]|uniref:hypothetical protein n=1 Tax=Nocardia terpenica TaxID=455432 RepID=UPI00142D50B3|nr:hypothetical protein [Nocardia terpenica]
MNHFLLVSMAVPISAHPAFTPSANPDTTVPASVSPLFHQPRYTCTPDHHADTRFPTNPKIG